MSDFCGKNFLSDSSYKECKAKQLPCQTFLHFVKELSFSLQVEAVSYLYRPAKLGVRMKW